jgi:MYXO-CTERM domain-containing protein
MNVKLLAVAITLAASSASIANAAQLIQNGGFEDGTVPGAPLPLHWTANAAFDAEPAFNAVDKNSLDAHSGNASLVIGNFDDEPLAILSQSFFDVAGATYSASLFVRAIRKGDPAANFTASIDGVSAVSLPDTINTYTLETFSFTGTGNDTLTLAGKDNSSDWFVDDVSITGPSPLAPPVSTIPEAASWAVMLGGVGAIGALARRRKLDAVAAR